MQQGEISNIPSLSYYVFRAIAVKGTISFEIRATTITWLGLHTIVPQILTELYYADHRDNHIRSHIGQLACCFFVQYFFTFFQRVLLSKISPYLNEREAIPDNHNRTGSSPGWHCLSFQVMFLNVA